jgi:hypothetical protein
MIPDPCSLFPDPCLSFTPEPNPVRLKAKTVAEGMTAGSRCCPGPVPASYNAKSGARINRRTGFDKLVASRMASAVVRFRTE